MSIENYKKQKRLEFAASSIESLSLTNEIAFVVLAENGSIDAVTAGEHSEVFPAWEVGIEYTAGNIRRYNDNLYKCLQAHTSQEYGWDEVTEK